MGRRSLRVDLRHTNKLQRIEAACLKNTHTYARDFFIASNLWVEVDWETKMHLCWRERKLSPHMDFYKARTVKRWEPVGMGEIEWEKRWRIKPIRERRRSRKSKVGGRKTCRALPEKPTFNHHSATPLSSYILKPLLYLHPHLLGMAMRWSRGNKWSHSPSQTGKRERGRERDHSHTEDPDTNTHSLNLKPNN